MWAYKVELVAAVEDAQGYAVDLAGNQPPTWIKADAATPTTRFLETANLRRSVRSRVKKLESGVDPQTLGLGKDCVQPDVGRLLVQLARVWVETPAPRQFTRRLVAARSELVSGLESIHVAISGKAFKSGGAGRHWDYSRRDAEQIAIYQGARSSENEEAAAAFTAEKWETLDESANGFRIRRKGSGERLSLGQLIGLRPAGARGFILSEVRWLMAGIDGSLTVGASALPGLAKAVAVRPANTPNNAPEPYVQAFLLPNAAAQPGSLVMPSGWYQHSRELEVRDEDELIRVKLAGLAQRGHDYDRANFSLVSPDGDRLRREPLHPPRREHRGEPAALPDLARHLEPRLVAREHVLHDREPEAGAAGIARTAVVDAVEALGEPRDVPRLDADAGVLHRDPALAVVVVPLDRDAAVARRVADRVRHEVRDRAAHLVLVAP